MSEVLNCLVEIPKGSRNKYEWDEKLQAIKLDRFLFSSVVYPTDYGFLPDTLGADTHTIASSGVPFSLSVPLMKP